MDSKTLSVIKEILTNKESTTFNELMENGECNGRMAYDTILAMIKAGIADVDKDGNIIFTSDRDTRKRFITDNSPHVYKRRMTELVAIARALQARDIRLLETLPLDVGYPFKDLALKKDSFGTADTTRLRDAKVIVIEDGYVFSTLTSEDLLDVKRLILEHVKEEYRVELEKSDKMDLDKEERDEYSEEESMSEDDEDDVDAEEDEDDEEEGGVSRRLRELYAFFDNDDEEDEEDGEDDDDDNDDNDDDDDNDDNDDDDDGDGKKMKMDNDPLMESIRRFRFKTGKKGGDND